MTVWTAIGATAIMLANMMLRPIGAAIDARRTAQSHEAEGIRYTLEVKCLRKDEQAIRALVFNALHQPGFIVQSTGLHAEVSQGLESLGFSCPRRLCEP